jgi:hypothetical protein
LGVMATDRPVVDVDIAIRVSTNDDWLFAKLELLFDNGLIV